MAKRKRGDNENQNKKKSKDKRGQGHFDQYTPWLKVQDVASIGLSTRLIGIKTGRIHHFLSTLEVDYFYLLDWYEDILDIREQYPLDLPETIALAQEVNLLHPPRSNPNNPIVMTTDFFLTLRQPVGTKEIARTIKYSKDLTSSRVLEKFEIERLYWKERNIDWGIVTELDIDKTLVKNIKWLYPFRESASLPPLITSSIIPKLKDYILPIVKKRQVSLRAVTRVCDKEFALPSGSSLSFVRHLLAIREWQVNMLKPIQPENPLNFIFGK